MDNNKISGSYLKVTAFQIIFAIFCEEDFKINCGKLSVLVDIETDSMDMLMMSSDFYTHFEITCVPCNLVGSNWCDLFTNRTIFCFKSHLPSH